MLNGKKIIVVLPAYNAESTLEQTYQEIPLDIVDEVLMVDDHSIDRTVSLAQKLGIKTILHERNYGYGRNQKTCYKEALKRNGDIVVMVHPDYQYTPKLIVAMASMIAFDVYDVVLGSRIIGGRALRGGMPIYKYIANRFLTAFENLLIGSKLSEFHTGYRAFSREVLVTLPLNENADDFVFDNEMLVQVIHFGYRIGELSCPTHYFEGASSINFPKAVRYGLGVIHSALKCLLHRLEIRKDPLFNPEGRKLALNNGQNDKR
jgi:glycosyltransferase involved in cell wall biosynthesis